MVGVRHAEGLLSMVVVVLHEFDARYAVAALDMAVLLHYGFGLDKVAQLRLVWPVGCC